MKICGTLRNVSGTLKTQTFRTLKCTTTRGYKHLRNVAEPFEQLRTYARETYAHVFFPVNYNDRETFRNVPHVPQKWGSIPAFS